MCKGMRRTDADVNIVTAVNHGRTSSVTWTTTTPTEDAMSDKELTPEELEDETGEELPDREAMSLINANVAAPVNAAVALNALSDNSVAYANAEQTAPITQSN
jgi:hypothetical protein